MLLSVYLLMQAVVIILFISVVFLKNTILDVTELVLSGFLMVSGWYIEAGGKYVWDASIRAYTIETVVISNGYIPAINYIFFGVTLVLCIFNIWETQSEIKDGINKVVSGGKNEKF